VLSILLGSELTAADLALLEAHLGGQPVYLLTEIAQKPGMLTVGTVLPLLRAQTHEIIPTPVQFCLTCHTPVVRR
jgi:hypothetical protein